MINTVTDNSCSKCSGGFIDFIDEGQLYTKRCVCYEQRRTAYIYSKRLEAAKIPERYLNLDFSHWKNAEDQSVFDTCKRFSSNHTPEKSGLFLLGSAGSGKTFLATCILKDRLKIQEGLFVSVPIALAKIAEEGWKIDYLDRLCEVECLVLDDLGTDVVSEKVQSRIYMIINERYSNNRTTIITSNIGLREITDRYGERIASRVAEFCIGQQLKTNKDWRLPHDA